MSQPEVALKVCHSLKWLESYVTAWSGLNVMSQPDVALKLCYSVEWI